MSHRSLLSAVSVLAVLAGCASQPSEPGVTAEQVTVHQSVASAPVNYRIIKRLWVESWRSAFGVPSYTSENEAADAFRHQAASLGGNGVINFACYPKTGPFGGNGLACNGTVVRFL